MPGYSGTPLAQKLSIKAHHRILLVNAPDGFTNLLDPLPPGVTLSNRLRGKVDGVHLFTTQRSTLATSLEGFMERVAPDGMIWISWPKRASKVPTDVTEDVVRAEALPLGLVDVKVCAVDAVWSGLKLVIRKELRERSKK